MNVDGVCVGTLWSKHYARDVAVKSCSAVNPVYQDAVKLVVCSQVDAKFKRAADDSPQSHSVDGTDLDRLTIFKVVDVCGERFFGFDAVCQVD